METKNKYSIRSKRIRSIMIEKQELVKEAAEQGFPIDMMVKHYVLGWILHGIFSTSISNKLVFKGGTALSKIHYPNKWRLSEDLDFTALNGEGFETFGKTLQNELPKIIKKSCNLDIRQKGDPYINPKFIRTRFSYNGKIGTGTVKIEITLENTIGDIEDKKLFKIFDYPDLMVKVYSISTILAEKLCAIIERGYIRDYYDVWRLLKTEEIDNDKIKKLFIEKLKLRGAEYTSVKQFFPENIVEKLDLQSEEGLIWLKDEEIPTMAQMIKELKKLLKQIL